MPSPSRFGRRLLQENLSPSSSSSFTVSQPSFIALISIIAVLVVAIIIAIVILCYRHYAHRRHRLQKKTSRVRKPDRTHLTTTDTPSSTPTYSIRSSRRLVSPSHPHSTVQQTNTSMAPSVSTIPSVMPTRRLQTTLLDAYLMDIDATQPNPIDPKQLNSYLFIDLHSTSSETYPTECSSKQHLAELNTTTSGYDTSTGGEDKPPYHSFKHRRRRLPYYHRQRRRSTMGVKRSVATRFLMRERSLPAQLLRLPQLRHHRRLMSIRDHRSLSTATTMSNSDFISTSLSSTTDDYEDSYAYRIHRMKTIDEEQPSLIKSPYLSPCPRPSFFFEKVSTSRGDESDMPIYDDIPMALRTSPKLADGIAFVNDSIIV